MTKMKRDELKAVTSAAICVVDAIEQLAGVAEDLQVREHDPMTPCSRGVVRLLRLPVDLANLRQGLAAADADALSSRYSDLVEWGGKAGRSYCEVALTWGNDLYANVILCLSNPPDGAWGEDFQPVDEAALRADWNRIAQTLDEFAQRVPWREFADLRACVTEELERATQSD